MKSPVVFRASFQQPKGALNPMGVKMQAAIEVEVYQSKVGPPAEWKTRRPFTKLDFPITPQSRFDTVQSQMVSYFEKQVSEWEAFNNGSFPEVPLQRDEWAVDKDGKVFLTEIYRERLKGKNSVTK